MFAARSRLWNHYTVGGMLSVAAAAGAVIGPSRRLSWTEGELPTSQNHLEHFLTPSKSSILIPTLEATARAARLFSTAVLMVVDYRLANLWLLVSQVDDGRKLERENWESEAEKRRKDLEESQIVYMKASHKHLDYAGRVEAKRKEKQAMLEAAERLAEAEEKLSSIGSVKSDIHTKAANRILELCRRNGGVYIKIGQHLANLDYLLPKEYTVVLSSLFDDTPTTPYQDVSAVIEQDLGKKPNEIFADFDPKPLASASLAQVHVAYDKETRRKLAVKVQHRGLRETSKGDIFALVSVVRLAERIFPDFTYGWLADEIAPHLPKELDFINEGHNAERAAEYLKLSGLDCIVPKIHWKHTTSRVLVMEFEEGFKATDLKAIQKAGLKKQEVAHLVSSVFSSQVFAGPKGWVHCDPHPGNLLVRPGKKGPQVVLLDHGLYRELDDDFRVKYAHLWKSLMLADLNGIKQACYRLGVEDAYPLFAAVLTARPFDELIERSKKGSLHNKGSCGTRADHVMMRGYAQKHMLQIFHLLSTLPRQMLLLLKMNDCLRHIDYSLGSPTNTIVICGRYAAQAVLQDTLCKSSSWSEKMSAWFSYIHVLLRIRLHNTGVWWLQQVQNLQQISWQ